MIINHNPKLKKFGMEIYSYQQKRLVSHFILKHKKVFYHLKFNKTYYLNIVNVHIENGRMFIDKKEEILNEVDDYDVSKFFSSLVK